MPETDAVLIKKLDRLIDLVEKVSVGMLATKGLSQTEIRKILGMNLNDVNKILKGVKPIKK